MQKYLHISKYEHANPMHYIDPETWVTVDECNFTNMSGKHE